MMPILTLKKLRKNKREKEKAKIGESKLNW